MSQSELQREILGPLWKVHILYHAQEAPIIAHWMLEELREHGYRVSPGTLYPLLARMEKIGWLETVERSKGSHAKGGRPYRATAAGRRALREVQVQLRELLHEVYPRKKSGQP